MKRILLLCCLFFELTLDGQSLTVNPNPFAQRTQVCYTLTTADTITIVIYNRWGQEILTLTSNSIKPAGVYCDSLIMDSFEIGNYFLIFKNKQKNLTNKVITKTASTNIQTVLNDPVIKIYPNPVQDKITIQFRGNLSEPAKLTIVNALGKQIFSSEILQDQFDLDFLPKGIYFFKLQTSSEQKTFKIIKE